MKVMEFVIFWHIDQFLWRPVNALAHKVCEAFKRKNLTQEQIEMFKDLGVEIKADMLSVCT